MKNKLESNIERWEGTIDEMITEMLSQARKEGLVLHISPLYEGFFEMVRQLKDKQNDTRSE